MWETLNFITWLDVRRLSRQSGLKAQFEHSTLYDSINRIGEDEEFRERHKDGMVGKVYKILKGFGILALMRLIPPALATPMVFKLTKDS